jgi:hypothetical protein
MEFPLLPCCSALSGSKPVANSVTFNLLKTRLVLGWEHRRVFRFAKRMFGIEHSGTAIFQEQSWLSQRWFGGELCDDDRM